MSPDEPDPRAINAQDLVHQYFALAIDGTPPMGEGSTPLDGKPVTYRGDTDSRGTVLGPARLPEFVWVLWDAQGHGLVRITDLKEIDEQ